MNSDDRIEWAARARSFGQAAESYERYRPGYPPELYVDVIALAQGERVLDAGAGTGRATTALAEAGASVHAVEPDPSMAAVLRERTQGLRVTVQEAAFEQCDPPAGSADLVVSAQAWHWVDPELGPRVAARALVPDGVLAVWWNRPREMVGPVWDAVHEAYARHAPDLDRRTQVHSHRHGVTDTTNRDPRTDQAAPGFTAWSEMTYEWSAVYGAEFYTAMVATHSDHLRLDAATREPLLDAVRRAIDEVGGGQLEYPYRTILRYATVL